VISVVANYFAES
jgi:hypothetical protein